MAITLITGAPGQGKTLLLLWEVERRRQAENRKVFYSGVKNLLLPWELFGLDSPDPENPHMTEPSTWHTLPVGSIIVIDECQRLFRTRAVGSKVPEYVAALETHRHKGYDIYLVTQAPALVDSNVRNLVETHKHLMRKFGSKWATIHEWKGVKTNCIVSRKDSQESQFRYPREVYGWYKSAELHTVKFRIPPKVLVLLAMPFVLVAAVWFAVSRLDRVAESKLQPPGQDAAIQQPLGVRTGGGAGPVSTVDYLGSFVPRVPSLPHTAPRYDSVTQPTIAPYPAACVAMGDECRCYTTQATRLNVEDVTCRSIAERGFFVDWDQSKGQGAQQAANGPQQPVAPRSTTTVPAASRSVTAPQAASSPDVDLIASVRASK